MLDQLSACPSCSEPLEAGDRFCGMCGADLTTAAPANGAGPASSSPSGAPVPPPPPPPPALPPAVPPAVPAVPPAVPAEQPATAAPAPASGGPPTEVDFTLPPAQQPARQHDQSQPAQAPYEQRLPVQPQSAQPQPAQPQSGQQQPPRQPEQPQPERSVQPQSVKPAAAAADPRATDPRTMLDDTPPAAPPVAQPGAQPGAQPENSDEGTPGSALRALVDAEHPPTGGASAPSEPHAATAPDGTLTPTPTVPDRAAAVTLCVACGTGAIDGDGYCEHCGHKQPRERDHMESELHSVAAASDRGLRHHRNEDFFALVEAATQAGAPATIAVVCDGVSSATRPDDASAAAARTASTFMQQALPQGTPAEQIMHGALLAAAEAVTALAAEGPNEPSKNAPACTVVSALTADGILTVGWVGDSRAYWIPEDRTAPVARLTEDDSWAAQMVAARLMTEDEAYADARAHAITGWLGADAYEVEPHTASFKPDRPGVVVVCTDGLWNYAESAEQMAAVVPPDARARPLHAAQRLVGYALDGGGHDNVTVAVVPFPVRAGGAAGA